MSERTATDLLNLRLPLYAYAAPLWHGLRVLEIGCGDGTSADYLAVHGAERVLSIDADAARVDRARAALARPRVEYRAVSDFRQMLALGQRFDVILVPEGQAVVGSPDLIIAMRTLLSEGGRLIMAVPAAERKGRLSRDGVGYYDLADALAAQFPVIRMLGQTPFLGFGLVEFDGNADALRVDVSLLHGGAEQPSHYIAIAGTGVDASLGYSLVQVPFAPVEALLAGAAGQVTAEPSAVGAGASPALTRGPGAGSGLSDSRAESAERRMDETERRARARVEEADLRLNELRRKLEDALLQAETASRISRAQAEEIEELRGRIRRGAEDRAAADEELAKLRRALAQADESVLMLTRRTAEEISVVAEKMATGLARVAAGPAQVGAGAGNAELEDRARRAEEAAARDRAEVSTLSDRIRVANDQIRALEQRATAIAERDDRIANLEGDKQDLIWRVTGLEEKLLSAEASGQARRPTLDEIDSARISRDRAIEELHRGATAHADQIQSLQTSLAEQAALVAELEDGRLAAESRAVVAEKEAATLRRNAKDLEEADRSRRGRLAELEGKLLRLERERAAAAEAAGDMDAGGSTDDRVHQPGSRLAAAEHRALVAEQRAMAADDRVVALSREVAAARNGHSGGGIPTADLQAAVAGIEDRLRDEMRALGTIEQTLERAREEAARTALSAPEPGIRADLERTIAAKDSQLIEGRLELARLRRESEIRQAQLEREIGDLRGRLNPTGAPGISVDHSQSAQLILMHSTLANIRRRSARLRDELEGFRRRLDTLPPGALSSMLEEIGEDLAEFAK